MSERALADAIRYTSNAFWYVYILLMNNNKYYTGYTQNLNERLDRHQKGAVPDTAPFLPVQLVFYCAFNDKYLAINFEKYLKSGSGRAFMRKRLIK